MERWRAIPGWPGYEMSDQGRLGSWRKSPNSKLPPTDRRILTGGVDKDGYRRAVLTRKGDRHSFRFTELMQLTWLPKKPRGRNIVLAHEDGDRANNKVGNLRWKTQKENILDKCRHGTMVQGEKHMWSVLTEKMVREIRSSKETVVALAKKFNVGKTAVYFVRQNRTWRWLK